MTTNPTNIPNISTQATHEEFIVGDTKFYIRRLPAIDQNTIFEEIRYHLATKTDLFDSMFGGDENLSMEEAQTQGAKLFTSILKLEPKFIRFLCDELFKGVTFINPGRPDIALPLIGNENIEAAFANISFTARYELLVRCLKLNFSDSLESIVSALSSLWGGTEDTPQSNQEASPLSFRES